MTASKAGADFEAIHHRERERIRQHRCRRNSTADKWCGLAISGGGIRSASFGLGVLQALAAEKFQALKKIDYLSTVSGGGYIGSALTWLNHLQQGQEWHFPLGIKGKGARSRDGNSALDYIRQHGDYLTPGKNLSAISLLATVLRNTLLTAGVYFMLLLGLVFAGIHFDAITVLTDTGADAVITRDRLLSAPLFGAALAALVFVAVTIGYAFISWSVRRNRSVDYSARVLVQKTLGWLLTIIIAFALLASLPVAYAFLEFGGTLAAGVAASAGGVAGGFYEFLRQRGGGILKAAPGGVRIAVTAFLLIYGLLLLAYILASHFPADVSPALLSALFIGAALLFGFFINTNYFGLGRMYRDRLIETFLPDPGTIRSGVWDLARQADDARLAEMCGADGYGPYHLINCNAVMVDSQSAKYRGRGGDSFLLSPLYCGSNATGWCETGQFLNNRMTLGTAMAISGAAANPNAGVAGRGPTRNRLVSFLMAYLGLRLGYWAWNPAVSGLRRFLLSRVLQPNLLYPGILQGLLGHRLNESAGYLELTDGGHFENTGLYELARRRLDVIIISDAGADPEFSLSDLGDAIERIRVDFGYYIDFDDAEFSLQNLMPGSAQEEDFFDRKYCVAMHGFAVGRIEYDENHSGTIIYIKSTMIRGLPGDVYAYKQAHPAFPHQSTADQFFDEVQLEAYRELGYRVCKQMLEINARDSRQWI